MMIGWCGICGYKARETWVSTSMGDFAADCPQLDATCLVSMWIKREP